MQPLPIDAVLPDIVGNLRAQSNLILRAPTGAGKTTRVPPALLELALGQIVLLEPRRLAARAAAGRMADEHGSRLGDVIGYHVRFDRCASRHTRILVVTPGILLRRLHEDPYLEKAGVVLFDEFHERGLENDLALGMLRLVQQTVRPALRLVAMSATLAAERIARYLGDCPVVTGSGRLHPVQIEYDPRPVSQPWPVAVAGAVGRLLDRTAGDLLVFLPGLQEIRQTSRHLEDVAAARDLAVVPLYGDLPAAQQDAALLRQDRRKVVLATNVAESSVTVAGITGVIDTGLARQQQYDPRHGLDRLQLVPISRSSADQRAGRAGREQPGICIRLWSEASHRQRPEETEPEIRRVDLAGAVLQLLRFGEKDAVRFPWLDPPLAAAVDQAETLVQRLGALTESGTLTEIGSALARLPIHPRLGRLLIDAQARGAASAAAMAAALLSERDPFMRGTEVRPPRDPSASDILDRVEALEAWEQRRPVPTALSTLNRNAAHFVLRARNQLLRELGETGSGRASLTNDDVILRALLAAFPDRVIRRREPGSRRGLMVGGRGVRLAPDSAVTESELFLGIDVDAGQAEALVRQASAVRREWLPPERVHTAIEVEFDPAAEQVRARKRVRYEDLLLEESPAALPAGDAVGAVLAQAAVQNFSRVLPPDDSPAGQYLMRLRCLMQWLPELDLPEVDEAALAQLVPLLCAGCRSFEDLRRADWLGALQNRLTYAQRQAVEREAPERIQVPSGSRIVVHYEVSRPPVLAVRVQEMFGLPDTPRIAAGRIRVLLHLLAPNHRPQQVTDDLASFWKNTYPLVRKDLRARYPKHAWPEDPLHAEPQHRPRRK
jgi:ATP-dependent helicase HrpB